MIAGDVIDPRLTLDNYEITRRHVTAFLLQAYLQFKLPLIPSADQRHLFAVLGTVPELSEKNSTLNRYEFELWMKSNPEDLKQQILSWIPDQLSSTDKAELADKFIPNTLQQIDAAIEWVDGDQSIPDNGEDEPEVQDEPDDASSRLPLLTNQLLDRLLYKGVLPRYAFPTDVADFLCIRSHQFKRLPRCVPLYAVSGSTRRSDTICPRQEGLDRRERIHFGCHLFADC